ncbi:thioredoxin reductase-like selenoprotein T isoform X2 [Panonychus citri]|uniref:thioredoxin reductase-like selenoprotein T isoform X2 n=1 Tax=Panonychus citri TaxID=50023 RepID=UPI002307363C|nr:thioredoxin reductase-like selenoprotein T isoform X2 [Panonychus citri]
MIVQIPYSCGYRRAFEEYERIIKEKDPKIVVIGENHSPNFIRLAISQSLSFGKFVVIGLIVSSINPFSYFGMATPTYWNMLSQHRLYGSMMIFFICNTLESYLMSTGAFEITYNGVLIWSKLKSGRMISPQELFSLINIEQDLNKGDIIYSPTS